MQYGLMEHVKQRAWKALGVFALVVLCACSAVVSWSQATQQFTGHVLDSTGAVIPAARVDVHNQATGVDVKAVTTNNGDYTVTYLTPGTYNITVSKEGFKAEKKTDIQLNVDQTSTIDFQLSVGAQTEVITVTASETQVELSKSDNGEIIDNERIQEAPLDGRNPYGLFDLSPGTHDFSSSQYPRPFDNVTGNQVVNGSFEPSQQNIDGASNEAADLGRTAFTPSVDVVQEYKIVMNAYDASYGHSGGSAVDVSLKSGSNKFHGTADYYARRQWLDTYDYQTKFNAITSNTPALKLSHRRSQESFVVDGPVVIPHLINGKNKLFFIASYERMRDILPNPSYNKYSVPNPAWVTGDFSTATYWNNTTQSLQPLTIYDPLSPLTQVVDPVDGLTKYAHSAFPGNKIPSSRIDPVAANILSYLSYVKPNANPGAGFAPWSNNYVVDQVENDLWQNKMVKIDYNPSDANNFSFRWAGQGRFATDFWNTCVPEADPANSNGSGNQPQTETGSAQWTHIFKPNLVLNVSSSVMVYTNEAIEGDIFPTNEVAKLGFAASFYNQIQSKNRFLNISSNGLPNASNFVDFGPNWLGFSGDRHALDFLPTLTYINGAHSIRAGVNVDFYQWMLPVGGNADNFNFTSNFTNEYGGGTANNSDAAGYASGLSTASLLIGAPNSGSVNWTDYPFYSQHYIAPWVQDDWKVTKKLTLNLGLRWDFITPEVERHNKMTGAFNETVLNPVSAVLGTNYQGGVTFAGVNGQSRGAYKMNKLEIQPRFGFAYAFSDRMSLRGGIGENYLNVQMINGSDGFSSSTSYNNSLNNGLTPYTATTGQGLSNPIPVVPQPSGSSLGLSQDLGKSFSFINPNYQAPAFWSWSLTYEIAPTRHDAFSVSYVGNRVPNNPENNNINQISPSWNAQCDVERGGNHNLCDTATGQTANPFLGIAAFGGSSYFNSSTLSKSNFTRPFPEFGDIIENGATNDGKNWYNSFQAVGSHQLSGSLSLHATYTHAKAEASGFWVPGANAFGPPGTNPTTGWVDQLNHVFSREVSTFADVKHAVTLSGVGILPFGKNRLLLSKSNRFVDEIVNGWEITPLFTYYSGFAWRPQDSGGNGSTVYDQAGNWEMASTGGPISKPMGVSHTTLSPDGTHNFSRIRGVTPCVGYKDPNTGAIIPSPAATAAGCASDIQFVRMPVGVNGNPTYGVGRQNIDFGVRQPGGYKLDIAASKNFSVPEGSRMSLSDQAKLQIRVDFLNAFNHADWDESYNSDPTSIDFGTIGKGPNGPSGSPRYLQLSGKLTW
jgi:hypothetical protein